MGICYGVKKCNATICDNLRQFATICDNLRQFAGFRKQNAFAVPGLSEPKRIPPYLWGKKLSTNY